MYAEILKKGLNFKKGDKLAVLGKKENVGPIISCAKILGASEVVWFDYPRSVKSLFIEGFKIIFDAELGFSKDAYLYSESNEIPWLLLAYPVGDDSALWIKNSLEFGKKYTRKAKSLQEKKIRKIEIRGEKTSLDFKIPPTAKWQTSRTVSKYGEVYYRNLPSFEINIAPDGRYSVGFCPTLNFLNGKDLQTNERAGEIGIVLDPIVFHLSSKKLIVENTGHHIGLGQAMQQGIYYNKSKIHKDVLIDDAVVITGITVDGKKVRIA